MTQTTNVLTSRSMAHIQYIHPSDPGAPSALVLAEIARNKYVANESPIGYQRVARSFLRVLAGHMGGRGGPGPLGMLLVHSGHPGRLAGF